MPPWRGGGGDDPPGLSSDGPHDARGGQCLPTGIAVADFPPGLHLWGGLWDLVAVPITLAVILVVRVRMVRLQVTFSLTGVCVGLGCRVHLPHLGKR